MSATTSAIAGLLLTSLNSVAHADHIAGTGELAGKVTAPSPFKAAKVFAHLSGKNITYVVFTQGGQYSAVNVMPGTYEVWVDKPGFTSEKKSVVVAPEKKAEADIALNTAPMPSQYLGARIVSRKVEPFDKIYPPGPGRDIIERTCFVCHGLNFLSAMPQDRQGWSAALDYMMGVPHFGVAGTPPFLSAERMPAADREVLLDYLAANIGPNQPERIVGSAEPDGPKDENVLGKAEIIEYELPNDATLKHRILQEITFDSKGNVWVTDVRDRAALTRIDPRTGAYTDYPAPGQDWNPHGIAIDADDTVWFAALKAGLGHLDPATGKFDIYGKTEKKSGGLSPFFDSKGNVYWTDIYMNELGRWDRKTNTWKRYPGPTVNGSPYGMVIDQKDRVWYAEFHGCSIVRFDPATEQLKAFKSPSAPCTIRRPGVDSKGNIWYGIWSGQRIERLDPETGKVTAFNVPVRYANPYDTWVDPHDIVWSSSDNYLIRLDPSTGTFSFYPTARQTDEPKMTITRDGAVWYPPRGYSSNPDVTASADVLYPDKTQMKTFGAYFSEKDANANSHRYHGPPTKVAGNAVVDTNTKASGSSNPDVGPAAD